MNNTRPSFELACAVHIHRFTMEHIPDWVKRGQCIANSAKPRYDAPHFRTDREWYDSTIFPGEPGHQGPDHYCYTRFQTWPLGMSLKKPFPEMLITLAILNQKYVVAREIRTLVSIQYGRDSAQFKKADGKCVAALAKYEGERTKS